MIAGGDGRREQAMKLLIMSDSHRHDEKLADAIMEHPEADAVIFLGDGQWDFENALQACGIDPDDDPPVVCRVRGNCDRASTEKDRLVRIFGNVRFLITHGHEQNAKYGVWGLIDDAKKHDCTAVLYGHTHRKAFQEKEGITLINPGSAANGDYCLLEVADGKITVLV